MPENIVEHEEVKIVCVRPVYALGKNPTITITYRLKQTSLRLKPGDVVTLIKNPVRQCDLTVEREMGEV